MATLVPRNTTKAMVGSGRVCVCVSCVSPMNIPLIGSHNHSVSHASQITVIHLQFKDY